MKVSLLAGSILDIADVFYPQPLFVFFVQTQRGSHGAIRERVSFSVNTKGQKV
jgi:hypothetical protein